MRQELPGVPGRRAREQRALLKVGVQRAMGRGRAWAGRRGGLSAGARSLLSFTHMRSSDGMPRAVLRRAWPPRPHSSGLPNPTEDRAPLQPWFDDRVECCSARSAVTSPPPCTRPRARSPGLTTAWSAATRSPSCPTSTPSRTSSATTCPGRGEAAGRRARACRRGMGGGTGDGHRQLQAGEPEAPAAPQLSCRRPSGLGRARGVSRPRLRLRARAWHPPALSLPHSASADPFVPSAPPLPSLLAATPRSGTFWRERGCRRRQASTPGSEAAAAAAWHTPAVPCTPGVIRPVPQPKRAVGAAAC